MASELTVLQSVPTVIERAIHIIGGHLGYSYAGIALVEGEYLVVKKLYAEESFPDHIRTLKMRIGEEGIAGVVARTGETVIVPDTKAEIRYIGDTNLLRSCVVVPVRSNARLLGVINVENPVPDAFTAQDVEVIQTLADQVAIALENSRLYHMLEEKQEQLVQSERLRAVGELAAGVAHNFNNLLTCVVGYTELLQMEPSLKLYDSYLNTIMQSAQQGARIARQLQEFTRIRSHPNLLPLDVNDFIGQALRITEPRWQSTVRAADADIQVNRPVRPVPQVAGNPVELVEVFTHLILNAVDAMPGGGTLTIEANTKDGMVQVRVGDTGTGMDEETAARIFEPFFTTQRPGDRSWTWLERSTRHSETSRWNDTGRDRTGGGGHFYDQVARVSPRRKERHNNRNRTNRTATYSRYRRRRRHSTDDG